MIPAVIYEQQDDVVAVEPAPGWRLHVSFQDGVAGVVDMERLAHAADAGVFAVLADPDEFAAVGVAGGAVSWPCGLDLAPDAMHAQLKAHGVWTF